MTTNDEIIRKETKELFEWIGHLNYDVNKAFSATSTPSNSEREAIIIACNKMLNEARADAVSHRDMEIIEAINSNKKIGIDLTEHDDKIRADERIKTYDTLNKRSVPSARMLYEMKMHTAKEIFKELDTMYIEFPRTASIIDDLLAYANGETFMVLMKKDIIAFKKKWGIEG